MSEKLKEIILENLRNDINYYEFEDLIENFSNNFCNFVKNLSNDAWLSERNIIEKIKEVCNDYLKQV